MFIRNTKEQAKTRQSCSILPAHGTFWSCWNSWDCSQSKLYYSINWVQWLPSGEILWLAWVLSMITTDRSQQIWTLSLHLLSSLFLLLIRALSQGVMLLTGSTVGLSLNRHIVNAIIPFRKSLRSGELRFYSCCIKAKPSASNYLKQFCDSVGLSSAQPCISHIGKEVQDKT